MKRFSFNINGQRVGDVSRLNYFMRNHRPTTAVVMDDIGLAQRLHDVTEGETTIIHRAYRSDDDKLWRYTEPSDFFHELTGSRTLPKNIVYYALNEPYAIGDDVVNLTNWLIELGQIAGDAGYKLSLGNIGPATWRREDIEAGYWDEYLKKISEWSHADIHLPAWHAYTTGFLPFGTGYVPADLIVNRDYVAEESWPTVDDLPLGKIDNSYPPYWHILREVWFDIRSDELGIKRHKRVITEFGVDAMPDVAYIYEILRNSHGVAEPHSSLRCWNSFRNVYQYWFPDKTLEEAIFDQLKWAEDVFPSEYIGFNMFTWSHMSPDWGIEYGCDQSKNRQLHDLLIQNRSYVGERIRRNTDDPSPPNPPTPEPPPEENGNENNIVKIEITGFTTSANYLNVRDEYGLNSRIVSRLNIGDEIYIQNEEDLEIYQSDGYNWVKFWRNPEGQEYWVALLFTSEEIVDTPVDPPDANDIDDLLEYIKGDGQPIQLSSGEIIYTENHDDHFFNVRNRNWRHGFWDKTHIYFGLDIINEKQVYITSRDGYFTKGGVYGYQWLPRKVTVGNFYVNTPYVIHLDRETGNEVGIEGRVENFMHVVKRFENWRGLDDVIQLAWYTSDPRSSNSTPVENYFYARNYGLVGWNNNLYTGNASHKLDRANLSWFDPMTVDRVLDNPSVPEEPINPNIPMIEEIKRVAYRITRIFEGGGYDSFQTYDGGIVSYGAFQFTLASGSLLRVLEVWISNSNSDDANEIEDRYIERVAQKDETLANDSRFEEILIRASGEKEMREAQDSVADTQYWKRILDVSVYPRNIQTPLGVALMFDMGINHGVLHDMFNLVEKENGVPAKSPMPENGVDEKDFFRRVVEIRKERLDKIAQDRNLPGLSVRGDFWSRIVNEDNWGLEGIIDVKGIAIEGVGYVKPEPEPEPEKESVVITIEIIPGDNLKAGELKSLIKSVDVKF